MKPFSSALVTRLVDLALEEDLAFGDVTSSLFESKAHRQAQIVARENLVVCGLPLTEVIVARAGYSVRVDSKSREGDKVSSGTVIQIIDGQVAELTALERTLLNFLQRLCGVATYTRSIVEQSPGITLLDTRKTMPGFRLLDKYATATGGARNHRMNLGEMILVKNNHIDAAPGDSIADRVRSVLIKAQNRSGFYVPVQVEVRSEEELGAALEFSPAAVLLDNMEDSLIFRCLEIIKTKSPNTLCEVSGGIDQPRLKALAALGVDSASMGALTTRAPNVDISMKIIA